MKGDRSSRRSGCPISFTLDLLGDKWTLLVLRDMLFERKSHYGDFLKSPEGIATNILADRLRRLEAEGFITKALDPGNQYQSAYRVTQKTVDLLPILLEIILWGVKYDSKTEAPPEYVKQIRTNRNSVIRNLTRSLRVAKPGKQRRTSR